MEDLLKVGVITTTHGVRGEVKVYPTTDADRFLDLEYVLLDTGREKRKLEIENVKYFKNLVILKFKGIDNINDIEMYKKRELWVPREEAQELEDDEYYMQMDGQAVFKFAVKKVPEVIGETLERNQVRQEEIDWYVLHQANKRLVEAVAKRLGEPMTKFPMNLKKYGNTSSASIGILLDEMNRDGRLRSGQKIMLAGFGAGLTWGSCIVEWK